MCRQVRTLSNYNGWYYEKEVSTNFIRLTCLNENLKTCPSYKWPDKQEEKFAVLSLLKVTLAAFNSVV